MNKNCKQCTKLLPDTDEFFRPYVPRGSGLRKTTVGRNTVCRECEQLNNVATRIFKNGPKTTQEHELMEKLPMYYKQLVAIGGQPIGTYAKHVLQGDNVNQTRGSATLVNLLNKVTESLEQGDPLLYEYDRLMAIEMTEEPDVYQDMLENLRERTTGPDGRVTEKYKEKFDAVATRFDDYEDSYDWD